MDAVAEVLQDQKWTEKVLARRLLIWELHAGDGIPIMRMAAALPDDHKCSDRQVWRDWASIRALLTELIAPRFEEIRRKAEDRYEHIYKLAIAAGDLNAATRANDRIGQINGVLDLRAQVHITNQLSPLEEFEKSNGNGNGNGTSKIASSARRLIARDLADRSPEEG